MDIGPIPLPGITHQAPAIEPGTGPNPNPNRAETERRVPPIQEAELPPSDRRATMPVGPTTRIELHIDYETNEVFGRVINRDTGEPVREIPARELRNLQAHARELIRAMVDESA